jgi:long-chain fatty acid transport protein
MEQDYYNDRLAEPARVISEYDGLAGYGGYLGLMYEISEEWRVGFVARSPVPIELDGEEKIGGLKYDSEIEMTFPYSFDLGFGYKPDPKLTLAMALSYRLWGDMDEITVRMKGFPKNEIETLYENSWFAGIGMEYHVSDKLAFKSGLKYVQGSTDDKGINPGTVDIDLWNPTVGLAYNRTESTELNASVMFTYGPRKEYADQTFEQGHWSLILGARFKL